MRAHAQALHPELLSPGAAQAVRRTLSAGNPQPLSADSLSALAQIMSDRAVRAV